ncbi:MAG: porin [Desulfurivibrionaceae bacterium]
MKKTMIGASVAAACLLPLTAAAGTTLYGELSYSFNSVDEDREFNPDGSTGQDGLSGNDNVSLFGLKGSYGDDIKAFFHLQTGAKADPGGAFDQRFFFGGLEGDFGKVAYGRMTNAYKFPGFKMDPFYNLSHIGAGGGFAAGAGTYGLSPATDGFTDNALQYTTPSLAGFKLLGGVYVDDSNEDDHGYSAGISYDGVEGLNVGAVFASNDDTGTIPNIAADGDALRGYANYEVDIFTFGLSYENVDLAAADTDANYLYATGTVAIPNANTDISLSIGNVDDGPAEGLGFTAGAFYNITENTDIHAIYSLASLDADDQYPASDSEPEVISLGFTHKFSLSSN